ncbi:serine hydrolase domain-containing protein [Kitasatospora sp. NPDC059571]|uniref:serine hydrolase domain-containing protein n=1 Tax=Kitasatospora sp. NPDC059571 TaxID=3346871 RepID=UPI003681880D
MSARPLPSRPPRPNPRTRPAGRCAAALVAAAALVGLVPGPAAAGGRPDSPTSLQHRLDELVRAAGGPPGAIAVLRRGDSTEVYRAGVAEVGRPGAPRPDDHMRIASVAKAFSGAVALRLVDRGALALDDTIGQRLPDLPAAWHPVTLRQLLQHTSGLPDYTGSDAFRAILGADPHHVFDPHHLLDYAAPVLLFTPGSRYQYSNSDNIAVALMAEAATGRPYEELLGRLVDRPLGLHDTSLPRGYRLPEPYLHGYDVTPPDAPVDVSTMYGASGAWASGGIVSTPADLASFIGAYGSAGFLRPQTRRQQLAFVDGASEPAGPGVNAAGLGIFRYTTRCGAVYGHTGNTAGYTQFAAAAPDGSGAVTVSVSEQITAAARPALLAQLRDVEEGFVCALLNDRKP